MQSLLLSWRQKKPLAAKLIFIFLRRNSSLWRRLKIPLPDFRVNLAPFGDWLLVELLLESWLWYCCLSVSVVGGCSISDDEFPVGDFLLGISSTIAVNSFLLVSVAQAAALRIGNFSALLDLLQFFIKIISLCTEDTAWWIIFLNWVCTDAHLWKVWWVASAFATFAWLHLLLLI